MISRDLQLMQLLREQAEDLEIVPDVVLNLGELDVKLEDREWDMDLLLEEDQFMLQQVKSRIMTVRKIKIVK
jgi:hypothetical protein